MMIGRVIAAIVVLSGAGAVGYSVYEDPVDSTAGMEREDGKVGLRELCKGIGRAWSKRAIRLDIEEGLETRPASASYGVHPRPPNPTGAVVHPATSFFLDYSGDVDLRFDGDDVLLPLKAQVDALPAGLRECAEDASCASAKDCRKRDKCRELLGHWGADHHEAWVADSAGCTVTFIDEDTMVTAGHCVGGKDWSKTYVLLGSVDDGTVEKPFVRLPRERVVKIKCLYASQNEVVSPAEVMDWAILDVEPLEGEEIPSHYSIPLGRCEPEAKSIVRSRFNGLPLLQHDVASLGEECAGRIRVTNAGGGSGAPVLQNGEIVGVLKGDTPSVVRLCGGVWGDWCPGQPVTWIRDVLQILDEGKRPMINFDSGPGVAIPMCET